MAAKLNPILLTAGVKRVISFGNGEMRYLASPADSYLLCLKLFNMVDYS